MLNFLRPFGLVLIGGVALSFTGGELIAKTVLVTPVSVLKNFDPSSGEQKTAANDLVRSSGGDWTLDQVKNGQARVFSWFSSQHADVIFYPLHNQFDNPQACFEMMVEDGTHQFVGCALTSSHVVYRVNRGRLKIPWLRVKLNGRMVDYCWDGTKYDELSNHSGGKGCY